MSDCSGQNLSLIKAATTIIAARRKTMPTHFFTFEMEKDNCKTIYSFCIVLDFEIKLDRRKTFEDGLMMLSETYIPIKNKEILWHRRSNIEISIDQEAKDFAEETLASLIKVKAFL